MRCRIGRVSTWLVLLLWLFAVLGPLGPIAGYVHHHASGARDAGCVTCSLLYSGFAPQPQATLLVVADRLQTPLAPPPAVFAPVLPYSDSSPRAPPAAATA